MRRVGHKANKCDWKQKVNELCGHDPDLQQKNLALCSLENSSDHNHTDHSENNLLHITSDDELTSSCSKELGPICQKGCCNNICSISKDLFS